MRSLQDLGSKPGRALDQEVSRRFLTTEVRIRVQDNIFGIYGRRGVTGARFLRVLRIPCQSFHRMIHVNHPLSESGTMGQIVSAPCWLRLPSTHETKKTETGIGVHVICVRCTHL
jgi:hypothetical protein